MIKRNRYINQITKALHNNPIVALLGPRQSGKTTLARQVAENDSSVIFDLEKQADQARLANPELALSRLKGLVIIDEIQRRPELFSVLRPLADRPDNPAKFMILGSASPQIVRGVSESLAGRIAFVDLAGFDLGELGVQNMYSLWLRGGFPRSYLANDEEASRAWRENFIRTFLERDIPLLGIRIPAETLRRFWTMVAHYHAELWNAAELARSLGVSEHTIRHYLDILSGAYMVRQLPPWWENLGKRQYKSPKVFIRDSGLFHSLQGIAREQDLLAHPKLGASWEGFALEQVLILAGEQQAFFWRTHAGAELDLLLFRGGRRYGIEFKYSGSPAMTKSLHSALTDLNLDQAWIIHPGEQAYPLHDKVEALPLQELSRLAPILT
ncbi:MAG TPA: hypothetical protein DCZ95_17700 [Verrucomicrobia bacterium]|nr:MAG: hypothetical protein A2X46_07380 [Lentisphaerae bacterium GWF2_57_35]HBA85922.1 hypothetical protein [Verrucomicrobiota bacterium]